MAKRWLFMQAQAFTIHYKFIRNGWNGFSKPTEEQMLQLGSGMITRANVLPTTDSTDVKVSFRPWKSHTSRTELSSYKRSKQKNESSLAQPTSLYVLYSGAVHVLLQKASWKTNGDGVIEVMEGWANERKKHAIVYLLGAPLVFGAQLPQKKQINYPQRNWKTDRRQE